MQQAIRQQLADNNSWPQLIDKGLIRPGMQYAKLADLWKILIQQGFIPASSSANLGQDLYSDNLVHAVKKFQ